MAGLAEVERINLKVRVCAERGIELLRCGPCRQVDRHLRLGRPCYVCCSVHFLHLHPGTLNQLKKRGWKQPLEFPLKKYDINIDGTYARVSFPLGNPKLRASALPTSTTTIAFYMFNDTYSQDLSKRTDH
jgi:hypothetical protein